MKKVFALLLALMMILALCACGGSEPAATEPAAGAPAATTPAAGTNEPAATQPTEPELLIRIGLVVDSWTTDPAFASAAGELSAMCSNNGWELVARDLTADTVAASLESFVNDGCNIIVVQASQAEDAVSSMLPTFEEKGITLCVYDTDRFAGEACVAYSVICDNYSAGYNIGKAAALWANENIEGHAFAGVIDRESSDTFRPRAVGIVDALNEHLADGQVYQSYESLPNTVEGGATAAKDLLSAIPKMNLLVAWNSSSAVGAYDVLKNAGWDGIGEGMFSIEASDDALAVLSSGDVMIGCLQLDAGAGLITGIQNTVEYVCNDYAYPDGFVQADKIIDTPSVFVDASNLAEYYSG